MSELCTSITSLKVQVNIVPFGTIQIIDTHYSERVPIKNQEDDEAPFEFPAGSSINDSIIYEEIALVPLSI